MRRVKQALVSVLAAVAGLVMVATPVQAAPKGTSELIAAGNSNIVIDGYFEDWNDKPYSWEYNWDNSYNCWYWGEWYQGQCFKTPEGTYDENVRHKMSLYYDGDYVYLYVKFATIYGPGFNCDDYKFWVGRHTASFCIRDEKGGVLTYRVRGMEPGIYKGMVMHQNQYPSGGEVEGSQMYYRIDEDGRNNEFEMKIPIEQFAKQNRNIKLDEIRDIELFNHNLMYRRIRVTGTSTGPIIGIAASVVPVAAILLYRKRKRAKTVV